MQSCKIYLDNSNSLPARVLMKRISVSRSRKLAAGAALSCTSVTLSSHVRYFVAEFENPHVLDLPLLVLSPVYEDQLYDHCLDVISVHECLMCSPAHKKPGVSSLSADLLRPVADLIVPLLTGMFCKYLSLSRDTYSSLLQVLGNHIWESIRLVRGVGPYLVFLGFY